MFNSQHLSAIDIKQRIALFFENECSSYSDDHHIFFSRILYVKATDAVQAGKMLKQM